jgi:hypothetical protein
LESKANLACLNGILREGLTVSEENGLG